MVAEDWDGTERLTQCRIRQGSCYLKRNYPQFREKSRTGFVKYFSSLRVSRVSRPGFFELRDLWSRPKIRRNVLERRTKWRRVRRAPPINAKAGSIGSIGSGRLFRPRLSSTARGFWCLAILGLAQGDGRNMEKPEIVMKSTSTLPNLGVLNPWVFFHRFLCYFLLMKKIERSPASNRSILCGLPKIDHALLWLSGRTGSDTTTWSYCSWWFLYPRHLIYPDSVYVLALWMQFQVSSGILALVPPSLA